ncbi:MAG: hypothetical protein OXH31_03250 [Gammaproteobacteria bacterium]|nr:hypothetical protein [Gammaproteobacteria bacterium]
MFSLIIAPLPTPHLLQTSTKQVSKLTWLALFALISFTLCAGEPSKSNEPSESDDSVTVQPNGYFEVSAEHHLNTEVATYGDLIEIISGLTAEKLKAHRTSETSAAHKTNNTTTVSNAKPISSRTQRTWKRRILVLLDGERVTGTADRSMNVVNHLGTSLDTIKSLEGFLSTDVDSIQHLDPRVLNFVSESPNHRKTDTNESKDLEPEKTQS